MQHEEEEGVSLLDCPREEDIKRCAIMQYIRGGQSIKVSETEFPLIFGGSELGFFLPF
jgi:hypothetical protein